jgi:uncharacterized protein YcbK (DUF882 family)
MRQPECPSPPDLCDPAASIDEPLSASRRQLLARGTALLASSLTLPSWAQETRGYASNFWARPRRVWLRHVSGEEINTIYWSDGELQVREYMRLSWFMRDRVVNKAVYMNPVLLDIVYGVGGWLDWFGIRKPIILTSGHRDAARNMHIEGAVRNSLHISGDASDICIPDVSPLQVAKFGLWLGGGGVGWYPSKGFTHLDRGRLRAWKG